MTAEELTKEALARARVWTDEYPTTRRVLYRRIGVRQQQLYTRSGRINQDWAGICATVPLSSGAANIKDVADPVKAVSQVTKIEVEDEGTSTYSVGDEVNIVPMDDKEDAAFPPRATIRNMVVEGVGTDLDLVTSIKLYYVKLPLPIDPDDGAVEIELPSPHDELLIVDLARFLLKLAPGTDRTQEGVELLTAEEGEGLEAFDAYVGGFANQQSRLGPTPHEIGRV